MHPIFMEIGGLSIRWYGIMAALGFLLASGVVEWQRKRAGMTQDQGVSMLLIAIVGGIVGARLFYVIQFSSQFRGNWLRVFRVDQGGLVFYGGFFLAVAGILIYCYRQKLDIWRVFDVLVPGLALGHAAGRVGCFLNGCCYGKPTDSFPGLSYPPDSEPFLRYGARPLHPVQLYEAAINVVIFFCLIWLLKRCKRGVCAGAYIVFYGLTRFLNEFFRGDHKQYFSGLTPAQMIGLVIIPIGIGLVIYFQRRPAPVSGATAASVRENGKNGGADRNGKRRKKR